MHSYSPNRNRGLYDTPISLPTPMSFRPIELAREGYEKTLSIRSGPTGMEYGSSKEGSGGGYRIGSAPNSPLVTPRKYSDGYRTFSG